MFRRGNFILSSGMSAEELILKIRSVIEKTRLSMKEIHEQKHDKNEYLFDIKFGGWPFGSIPVLGAGAKLKISRVNDKDFSICFTVYSVTHTLLALIIIVYLNFFCGPPTPPIDFRMFTIIGTIIVLWWILTIYRNKFLELLRSL